MNEENNEEEKGLKWNDSDGKPVRILEVLDSYEKVHKITETLNAGGQGVVCRTENKEIVIKFLLDTTEDPQGRLINREKNKAEFERKNAEIRAVATKPFPDRLHIAYPMACLTDYSGYVMRFMGDMNPYGELASISVEGIKQMPENGGHRRRFDLLSKLAAILAKLHGNGMVYCDLSPNNVFVTADPDGANQNVWLIDADNVYIPGEDPDNLVYTLAFAAPELLEGKACTQYSDIYSFAILVFQSLAALHPFAGKAATNWEEGGDDWDATTKTTRTTAVQNMPDIAAQFTGKLPWVEDPEDDSNHTEDGLPRQNFLTDETFSLLNRTFCEEGREQPKTRPTAALWARALAHSHAASVCCTDPECRMSFVYDGSQENCPWCKKPLAPLMLLKNEKGEIVFAHELDFGKAPENRQKSFALPQHIFEPFDIDDFYKPVITVRTVTDGTHGLEFKLAQNVISDSKYFISINGKEEQIMSTYILQTKKEDKYEIICRNASTGICRTFTLEEK